MLKRSLLLVVAVTFSATASAEFFAWEDNNQERHISNIPAEGFTSDGKLKDSHNPHAIDYQYQLMLERLRQDSIALEEEALQENSDENEEIVVQDRPAPRIAAPKEGMLNLRELIDLEKRSGRPR